MLDPELKKLIEKLDPEDLKDLAALLGAGSLERQANAQLRKQAAELYPIAVVVVIGLSGVLITAIIGAVIGSGFFANVPNIIWLLGVFVVGLILSVAAAYWPRKH